MSTPSGRLFDAQFEDQIAAYRTSKRLIRLNGIHFKASRATFKKACRDRLSDQADVRFFWPQPDKPWNKHPGWVMLGFTTREQCDTAEQEFGDFEFWSRNIGNERSHKRKRTQPVVRPTAAAPTPTNPFLTPPAVPSLPTVTPVAAAAAITAAATAAATIPGATPATVAAAAIASAAPFAAMPATLPASPAVAAPVTAPTTQRQVVPVAGDDDFLIKFE